MAVAQAQFERVACPLCGAHRSDPYRRVRDLLFHTEGSFTLVRCRECRLVYLNPRPCGDALAGHYPSDYFCYGSAMGDYSSPARAASGNAAIVMHLRRRQLESITGPLNSQTHLLDVGCGANLFNYHLEKARGCRTVGLDFNAEVISRVRQRFGLDAVAASLPEADLPADHFDVVTMYEYLEHEPAPRRVLGEARRVLKASGYLAVETPDLSSGISKLFRGKWIQLDAPRHLALYDSATLRRLLEECGFEIIDLRPHSSPWLVGFSALAALGYRNVGRCRPWELVLGVLLSLPLLPLPWIFPEFIRAYARVRQ